MLLNHLQYILLYFFLCIACKCNSVILYQKDYNFKLLIKCTKYIKVQQGYCIFVFINTQKKQHKWFNYKKVIKINIDKFICPEDSNFYYNVTMKKFILCFRNFRKWIINYSNIGSQLSPLHYQEPPIYFKLEFVTNSNEKLTTEFFKMKPSGNIKKTNFLIYSHYDIHKSVYKSTDNHIISLKAFQINLIGIILGTALIIIGLLINIIVYLTNYFNINK